MARIAMKTICLIVEYDGTRFAGWQWQANGLSVQEVVEGALAQLLGDFVRVMVAGRTDAGVHARGQVIHFRTERQLPMIAYRAGLNRFLPDDVVIRHASEAPAGFHARHSAKGKWYRYSLYLMPVRSPLSARAAWHLRSPLNVEAMALAAKDFLGRHDFAAFRTSGCDARTTVRDIFACDLQREGDLLHIDVRGSGFLRHMVRLMVGTLVDIGLGKRDVGDVARLLRGELPMAGPTAPPHGLCLMEVCYESDDAGDCDGNFPAQHS
jgi:tRNA pseudouridine38-40 synthase